MKRINTKEFESVPPGQKTPREIKKTSYSFPPLTKKTRHATPIKSNDPHCLRILDIRRTFQTILTSLKQRAIFIYPQYPDSHYIL